MTATRTLLGRDAELALLAEKLDSLPARGFAVVLRGEAGIGKSVLLDAARALAAERRITALYTAGVATESDLPFAGLHRLLRGVMDGVEELAPTHRSALMAAFGIGEEPGRDPFLVSLATLELLSMQAASGALLVIADDIHWLDEPSRDTIAFVARRIESDPVGVLVALREGHEHEVGDLALSEHVLPRLAEPDASALLDDRAPGLPNALRARLLAEAAGNPLALVELPATASVRVADDIVLPLNTRLEQAFAMRLRDCPDDTQALLLIAAADESVAISEVLAAGEIVLGQRPTLATLQPAVKARLVAIAGSGLRFRHPLVRSAIYQSAELEQRMTAHAALASVFADEPDRRASHRAASVFGRDDSVAQDLEEMAGRVLRRGAVLEAAIALGRAGELSEDRSRRAGRLLRAGELAFQVGRADLVKGYVEEARSLGLGARDQARAQWLSEIFHDGVPGDSDRVLSLVATAEQARDDDPDLALRLLHAAGLRCWWTDPGADARARVVAAVEQVPVDPTDGRVLATIGLAEPIARSASVMAGVALAAPSAVDDPEAALLVGMAAHCVGDFDSSMRILRVAIETLRAQGRLGLLTQAIGMFASEAVMVCDWAVAGGAAAEFEMLARETNQAIWRGGAAVAQSAVAGIRGNDELAERYATEAERLDSTGSILSVLQNARGLAALAAGRYDDAYTQLVRMFDPRDRAYHYREKYVGIGNLADAAAATGRQQEVRELVTELTAVAEPSAERALLWGLHYARAVLAEDDHAESEFARALEAVGPNWVFNHARLNLAYGSWLRRQRRMSESRAPLRAARDAFDELDTPAWSERARHELRAAGETSRKRQPEAWDELSPQERQIAMLAAAGMSNREIGQQLYISHRTVASHLYRIFPKLGIASRGQLARVLPSLPADGSADDRVGDRR